jgi:formyl-CoA transferase/CoA:oxalate CoA-transferase
LKSAYAAGKKHTEVVDDFANSRLRADLPQTTRPVEVPDCLHRPTDRQMFPYYRVYQTHDGYISIAALHRGQRRKVCQALGLEDPACDTNPVDLSDDQYYQQKSLMRIIEGHLRMHPNAYWLQKLEQAGVPCAPVNYRSDLYTDPQAQALGLVWDLNNRDLGRYKASGHPIRFSKTPVRPGKGAPVVGEHSGPLLREFGYSDADIDAFKADGVVK